ncbi:transposase, partial [Nocardiopsis rhodophaea]|uniref:transposase n=1 Tax=Nocardiopsis rhodophaea TaxID=280238 RepID=UPI0031D4D0EA
PGTPQQPGSRRAHDAHRARARLHAARSAWDQALAHVQACTSATAAPAAGGGERPSAPDIAIALVLRLAQVLGRPVHVVADAAYSTPALAALPPSVTWTVRLKSNAVLHRAPATTTAHTRWGRPGQIADEVGFTPGPGCSAADAPCYRATLGHTPLRLVLIRNPHTTAGCDAALLTTDTATPTAGVIARYRDRWAIETCFRDAKQHLGLGQAHNRVPAAVRRTAPLQLLCYTLVICYYALHGQPGPDTARRRAEAPYYTAKAYPAFIDMAACLRRDIIRARHAPAITEVCADHPDQPEQRITEIEQILSDIGAL